jgi:CHAT domain-containing protein
MREAPWQHYLALDPHSRRQLESFQEVERARCAELEARLEAAREGAQGGEVTAGAPPAALDALTILAGLPEDVLLVVFDASQGPYRAWLARRGSLFEQELAVTAAEVGQRLAAFYRALEASGPEPEVARSLVALSVALVEPWLASARLGERLVLVPDALLQPVPFAALCGRTSRYLFHEHPLIVVPSASLFLATLERERTAARPEGGIEVLADPELAPERRGTLPALPQARAGAPPIAKLYRRARVRLGAAATATRLRQGLEGAEVVQVSAHTALERGRRCLLLAPDEKGSGDVSAGALLSASSPCAARLVALGACRSLTGGGGSPEQASLDEALLWRGASAVLGSLWDVDDAPAEALMHAFHRRFVGGARASEALQEAQGRLAEHVVEGLRSPRY